MLTSIIGYTLTALFAGLSIISFIHMFINRSADAKIGACAVFTFFGLLSLGTAHIAGL